MSSCKSFLRVGSLNCWSLKNKTNEVIEHLQSNSIDICVLQETFLKDYDTAISNEMNENGLNLYSLPRVSREHGGLGIVYKDSLKVKHVKQVKSQLYKTFEYVEATIKTSKGITVFVYAMCTDHHIHKIIALL